VPVPHDPNATADPDATPGPADPDATLAPPGAGGEVSGGTAGRLRLLDELGRGGMGAVLRARDPDLNRDLAVKVLREEHAGKPQVVRRFLEEAQIAGQLQHPGIAPVHQVGTLPDGRPFFSMKLVKGQTFAQLLRERPTPAHELPRFLTIFGQVCQTVAFAHSKRVVHRDLKPSNVMVGAFGEVQVMDWGLAKVLASRGREPPDSSSSRDRQPPETTPDETVSRIHTARDPDSDGSRAGSGLGTPAYMAPEQALGLVEKLDERTDVFGLGSVLCEVLTGLPPYTGADGDSLLMRAARADLADAFARLDGCGADAELTGLAKRCLAAEPGQRPADAAAVAEALAAYQAGVERRLHDAELQRARAEERAAAERKRRFWQLGLAAAVLVLALGGGGSAWWLFTRRAGADASLDAALHLVAAKRDEAHLAGEPEMVGRCREALAAAQQAAQLAEGSLASAAKRDQAAQALADAEADLAAAERDRRLLDRLLDVRDPREAREYRTDGAGQALALEEPTADEQFAAAFRDWGLDVDQAPAEQAEQRLRDRPPTVLAGVAAGLDEWAAERQVKAPTAARRLANLADAIDPDRRELRALLADDRLRQERAAALVSSALLPLGQLARLEPPRPARDRLRELAARPGPAVGPPLGVLLLNRALLEAGDGAAAERLLRSAIVARPGEPALWQSLGGLLEKRRPPRWAEAAECYAASRAVRPGLGLSLARALKELRRPAEGQALLEELTRRRPEVPDFHSTLATLLNDQRRYAEAEAEFREAIRLRPDWEVPRLGLGAILCDRLGRFSEAEAEFREALRLKPDSPSGHNNLGIAYRNQGRLAEAEAELRESIRLRPDYAQAHNNLANLLRTQRRFPEAEAEYRVLRRLRSDPYPTNLIGVTLFEQHRFAEAEAEFREAIRLKPDIPDYHFNLGNALKVQGRFADAEASYREAVRLRPDYPNAQFSLGGVLNQLSRHEEAEAAYREAVRLRPDHAEAHNGLAEALKQQGRYAESLASYRRGHELGSKLPGWSFPSADWVREAERLADLEARLPDLLAGAAVPADADLETLNEVCKAKGLLVAAVRFAAAAIAADPKLAEPVGEFRYTAACDAVLAATPGGEADRLPAKALAGLRRQSLDWLRAELRAAQAQAGKSPIPPQLRQQLLDWQSDTDLASVRDQAALSQLPEAERAAWRQLWDDLAALLTRTGPG
jgi:serine/threonine-protein kinase